MYILHTLLLNPCAQFAFSCTVCTNNNDRIAISSIFNFLTIFIREIVCKSHNSILLTVC